MTTFLNEPHFYPMNATLDIPKDYIFKFIDKLDDNDWTNHKSTKSGRRTEIWWTPIKKAAKYYSIPEGHPYHTFPSWNPKWDPSIGTELPKLTYTIILLKIHANDHMKPHTDGLVNPRRTIWSFPLTGSYADVKFYHNFDEESCYSYNGQMLMNTAHIHEVDNGPETRYNLQICFEDDIETVYQAHKEYQGK